MVDEEVGKGLVIAAPRQQDAHDGDGQQGPFHRALHNEEAEHEEQHDKGTHIDGTHCAAFLPILRNHLKELSGLYALAVRQIDNLVGLILCGAALAKAAESRALLGVGSHRGAALHIGNEQRPRLALTVAVLGDVAALQSAIGAVLTLRVGFQLRAATHRGLAVFPRMVEVRDVHQYAQQSANEADARSLHPLRHSFLTDGFHQVSHYHKENDEQEIVGHLHVVGMHLQCGEDCGDEQSPQVFAPVGQHDAGNHRRQIGQGHHLPHVACSDDDEEIGAEGPKDRAKSGQICLKVERAQEDEEAQHIGEEMPHIVGQP